MKIKATFLIISFSLLFGLISLAQKLSYGLSAGIDLVGIHVTEKYVSLYGENTSEPLLSYNINGYFAYKSKRLMGFTIEPGYMLKGYSRENSYWSYLDEPAKYLSSHIQLPILADFHISKHFFISSGIEFAYLMSSKVVVGETTHKFDLPDKRFQLSGIIGLNYEIMKNLDIALRYIHELPYYRNRDYSFMHYAQFLVRFKLNKTLIAKTPK